MRKFVKKLALSPRQLLNGQEVQRISGIQKFEVKFGVWNVENFCGKGTKVCEQLRKRKMNTCCLQEIRWKAMSLPGLKDTLDEPARVSGERWYGHVLRRDSNEVLRRALDFEMVGKKRVWATD